MHCDKNNKHIRIIRKIMNSSLYLDLIGGLPFDLLENYLIWVQLRCSKCAGIIEARRSKYGVYAKCTSSDKNIDVRALW